MRTTSIKTTKLHVSQGVLLAALLPLALWSSAAQGACGPTTNFCSSVQPKLKTYCTGCHTNKAVQKTDGVGAFLRYSMNMGDLGDWFKSSYWMPGSSKAHASMWRAGNGTMPPGVIPYSLPQQSVDVSNAIANWLNNCVTSATDVPPSTSAGNSSETTVWGPYVIVGGTAQCKYNN